MLAGVIGAVGALVAGLYGAPGDYHMPDRATAIEVGIKLATGVGALTAGLLAWDKLNLSHAEHVQRDRVHLDDRFNSTIALLGHDDEAVRLGALYALEALIHSDADFVNQQQIVDVVCSYLRYRTTRLDGFGTDSWAPTLVVLPTDYQAAATIALRSPEHSTLDLKGTVLRQHAIHRSLWNGQFGGATIAECFFRSARLVGCSFSGATITFTRFDSVDVRTSVFRGATITDIEVDSSDFANCGFERATIIVCRFTGSTLTDLGFGSARLERCTFDNSTITLTEVPVRYRDQDIFNGAKMVSDIRWVEDGG